MSKEQRDDKPRASTKESDRPNLDAAIAMYAQSQPTPRTDALIDPAGTESSMAQLCAKYNLLLEHARQLEREVADQECQVQLYREQYHEATLRLTAAHSAGGRSMREYQERSDLIADFETSTPSATALRELAERCRPAVAHDARLRTPKPESASPDSRSAK